MLLPGESQSKKWEKEIKMQHRAGVQDRNSVWAKPLGTNMLPLPLLV